MLEWPNGPTGAPQSKRCAVSEDLSDIIAVFLQERQDLWLLLGSRGKKLAAAWAAAELDRWRRNRLFGREKEPMPFVSITRLRVRSWFYVPAFVVQTLRIARQAARADGNLAVKLLRDRRNTFWTGTTWSSEDSVKAFTRAKPHGPTMRSILNWCDEAALVHWTQTGEELPAWGEAHLRIQQEGRRSKVNYPSAAQTAYAISAPTVSQTRELRFK